LRNLAKIAICVIAIPLLIGTVFDFYSMYTAARKVQVVEASIASVALRGFAPPFDPVPDAVRVTFRVILFNPTGHSMEVERIVYAVRVEGRHVGEGIRERIYIAPASTTTLLLYLEIRGPTAVEIIMDMLARRDRELDYEISGRATVPVRLFGLLRILMLEVPFMTAGSYTIMREVSGT